MDFPYAVTGTLAYRQSYVDTVCIYLMKFTSSNSDVYKMGVSVDPRTRMVGLKHYAVNRFATKSAEIVFSKEIDKSLILQLERDLLAFYKRRKVHASKEWFYLSDEIVVDFPRVVDWFLIAERDVDFDPEFIENAKRSVRKTFKQRQQERSDQ